MKSEIKAQTSEIKDYYMTQVETLFEAGQYVSNLFDDKLNAVFLN